MTDTDDTRAAPRDRLLGTLDELSKTASVLDVGINELLARSGVAKASLYGHFGSKEQLIVAWLHRRQEAWFGWLQAHVDRAQVPDDPVGQIDAAFDFLEAWLSRPDFSGCPFITVAVQLKDPTVDACQTAKQYAERLRTFFSSRLALAGGLTKHVETTSIVLVELYLGVVVCAQLGVGVGLSAHSSSAATCARVARTTAKGVVQAMPRRKAAVRAGR